jgi:hypothetical protein
MGLLVSTMNMCFGGGVIVERSIRCIGEVSIKEEAVVTSKGQVGEGLIEQKKKKRF